MTKPMSLADFMRVAPIHRATFVPGLASAIDAVAGAGPASHAFLRYQWFAAAVEAYGGRAATLVVSEADRPMLALPLIGVGPAILRLFAVPGSYWPFRSFPLADGAATGLFDAALAELALHARGVRIGPVPTDDPPAFALVAAARARGWTVIDRVVGTSWILDLAGDDEWPRGSTLRKNRFHEKHLAEHGALDWRFLTGADWPAGFAAMAHVEEKSWVGTDTDGRDAKFTDGGHGRFWRSAATDPVLAAMFHAALLSVDGRPAAFSFDIDAGAVKYAVANGYDPAFARHSPGKLLYYRNLIEARGRGIRTIDWGSGDSGYKQVLGAVEGPALVDYLLLAPGLGATAGRLLARRWRLGGVKP